MGKRSDGQLCSHHVSSGQITTSHIRTQWMSIKAMSRVKAGRWATHSSTGDNLNQGIVGFGGHKSVLRTFSRSQSRSMITQQESAPPNYSI